MYQELAEMYQELAEMYFELANEAIPELAVPGAGALSEQLYLELTSKLYPELACELYLDVASIGCILGTSK
jgi:hypothetical protein